MSSDRGIGIIIFKKKEEARFEARTKERSTIVHILAGEIVDKCMHKFSGVDSYLVPCVHYDLECILTLTTDASRSSQAS